MSKLSRPERFMVLALKFFFVPMMGLAMGMTATPDADIPVLVRQAVFIAAALGIATLLLFFVFQIFRGILGYPVFFGSGYVDRRLFRWLAVMLYTFLLWGIGTLLYMLVSALLY